MLPLPGKSSANVSRDNDFSLCSKLHQTRQLVLGQFPDRGAQQRQIARVTDV